jgi:hypothetical protein
VVNDKAPQTLMEAHLLLGNTRPTPTASHKTWLEYYRRSAGTYADVAEVDRGHHHEALYWANRERKKADDLAAEIAKNPALSSRPKAITTAVRGGEVQPPDTLITEV